MGKKLEGALPAISLNSQTGIMTAFANDKSWTATFAQQFYGFWGKRGLFAYIVGALCWKWIVLTLVKAIINLLEKN